MVSAGGLPERKLHLSHRPRHSLPRERVSALPLASYRLSEQKPDLDPTYLQRHGGKTGTIMDAWEGRRALALKSG